MQTERTQMLVAKRHHQRFAAVVCLHREARDPLQVELNDLLAVAQPVQAQLFVARLVLE